MTLVLDPSRSPGPVIISVHLLHVQTNLPFWTGITLSHTDPLGDLIPRIAKTPKQNALNWIEHTAAHKQALATLDEVARYHYEECKVRFLLTDGAWVMKIGNNKPVCIG